GGRTGNGCTWGRRAGRRRSGGGTGKRCRGDRRAGGDTHNKCLGGRWANSKRVCFGRRHPRVFSWGITRERLDGRVYRPLGAHRSTRCQGAASSARRNAKCRGAELGGPCLG